MRTVFITVAALVAFVAVPSLSQAGWELDTEHTNVGFTVKHMMVQNVRGHFTEMSGTFDFNEKDIEKSKIDVKIQAASINTNNEKRDKHLRSGDFLLADKHPELRFVSTHIKKKRGNKLAVTGDLTIRGVTKSVTLDVVYSDAQKGYGSTQLRGISGTTTIDRYDWGVSFNDTLETGGVLVGKQVQISFEAALVNKKAKSAQR